jgi:hypothetical protein
LLLAGEPPAHPCWLRCTARRLERSHTTCAASPKEGPARRLQRPLLETEELRRDGTSRSRSLSFRPGPKTADRVIKGSARVRGHSRSRRRGYARAAISALKLGATTVMVRPRGFEASAAVSPVMDLPSVSRP